MSLTLLGKAPAESGTVPIAVSTDTVIVGSVGEIDLFEKYSASPATAQSIRPEVHELSLLTTNDSTRKKPLLLHPSKLDLIDHTTLTSLPLPPPPARSKLKRGLLGPLAPTTASKQQKQENQNPSCLDTCITSRNDNAQENENDYTYDITDMTITSEYIDETFEESGDLIVLVEDYLASYSSKDQIERKKSLHTFKKRLHSDLGSENSVETSTRNVSGDLIDTMPVQEDLEAIFGKIPGTDRLKHCSLCDRPLYEISSIIGSCEAAPRGRLPGSQMCNEFVCWDCVDIYEQFLAELCEDQPLACSEKERSETSRRLHNIFSSIRETYDSTSSPSAKEFSLDLKQRLHHLNEIAHEGEYEPEWLKVLKQKLRWRWRINGLLPNLLCSDRLVKEA